MYRGEKVLPLHALFTAKLIFRAELFGPDDLAMHEGAHHGGVAFVQIVNRDPIGSRRDFIPSIYV